MKEITWSDGMGSRGRRARLWLRDRAGTMHAFGGETIPGVAVVVGSDYTKNGKWSANTYRIALSPGVVEFPFMSGWETGTIREGLGAGDTWQSFANRLGIKRSEAQRFLRSVAAKAADHYDKVEAEVAALVEAGGEDISLHTLCFGNPTNRQMADGWWSKPILILDETGKEVGRIVEEDTYVSCHDMVEVIDVDYSPGPHGGYVDLTVAMPSAWSLRKG